MSLYKILPPVVILALLIGLLGPVEAKNNVDLDRILREHSIHVVTTEESAVISRCLFDLHLKNQKISTLTDLIVEKSQLEDEDSVLFLIDRSKLRHLSSEEEELVPVPSAAIDSNEVILYAAKAKGRNAWEIMLSAPNEKWLKWELDRLCSCEIQNRYLQEAGSILDRYRVKRLSIVSTEGRQVAEDWVRNQSKPGSDAIDWDFTPIEAYSENAVADTDVAFLLDKQKVRNTSSSLISSLPQGIRDWYGNGGGLDEYAIEKQSLTNESGNARMVYAVMAPCVRHLKMVLHQYSTLNSIPESLTKRSIDDFSKYDEMVVVVRSGDRSDNIPESVLNDLGGKLTAALSSANTGIRCISRQDLKELIYAGIRNNDTDQIDSMELVNIRSKIGKACAIVVADLSLVNTTTNYVANSPSCETPLLPVFSQSEPSKPEKPDSNEVMLFKGHKYRIVDGSRTNDPHYKNDLRDYEHDKLPEYRRAHREWEDDRDDYESRRREHVMEWEMSIDSVSSASIAGNLRIYNAGNLNTSDAGQVIFTYPLKSEAESRKNYSTQRVTVQGEDNKPYSLSLPDSLNEATDATVISNALQQSCQAFVNKIVASAILPCDILECTPKVVSNEKIEAQERVSVEAVGIAKADARPVGADLETARQDAVADACSKLLDNIKVASPNAVVSEQSVVDGAKVISEGWNAQKREYQVRMRYESEVTVVASKKRGE